MRIFLHSAPKGTGVFSFYAAIFAVKSTTPKSARIKLERPLNRSFISSSKISHKAPSGRRCRPLWAAEGKQRNPSAFSCLFSYRCVFFGIRRNSSKKRLIYAELSLSQQKRKKGRTRRLQRRISPLCGSVGCLLDFSLARRTVRFLWLFQQREEFAVLFLSSAVIYTQWV